MDSNFHNGFQQRQLHPKPSAQNRVIYPYNLDGSSGGQENALNPSFPSNYLPGMGNLDPVNLPSQQQCDNGNIYQDYSSLNNQAPSNYGEENSYPNTLEQRNNYPTQVYNQNYPTFNHNQSLPILETRNQYSNTNETRHNEESNASFVSSNYEASSMAYETQNTNQQRLSYNGIPQVQQEYLEPHSSFGEKASDNSRNILSKETESNDHNNHNHDLNQNGLSSSSSNQPYYSFPYSNEKPSLIPPRKSSISQHGMNYPVVSSTSQFTSGLSSSLGSSQMSSNNIGQVPTLSSTQSIQRAQIPPQQQQQQQQPHRAMSNEDQVYSMSPQQSQLPSHQYAPPGFQPQVQSNTNSLSYVSSNSSQQYPQSTANPTQNEETNQHQHLYTNETSNTLTNLQAHNFNNPTITNRVSFNQPTVTSASFNEPINQSDGYPRIDEAPKNPLPNNSTRADTKINLNPQQFLRSLTDFMKQRNTPITKPPMLGNQVVNLWTLYSTVTKLGGVEQVDKMGYWVQIAERLGFNDPALKAPWSLKSCYHTLLLPFEQHLGQENHSNSSVESFRPTDNKISGIKRLSNSPQPEMFSRGHSPYNKPLIPRSPSVQSNQGSPSRSANVFGSVRSSSPGQPKATPPLASTKLRTAVSITGSRDKQKVKNSYHPYTRFVNTYGGYDLEQVESPIPNKIWPKAGELGVIDIHALTMSIKSGLPMETTNALNILSMLSLEKHFNFSLEQSPELCEAILSLIEDSLEFDDLKAEENDHSTTYSSLFESSRVDMCSLKGREKNLTNEQSVVSSMLLKHYSFVGTNQPFLARDSYLLEITAQIFRGRFKDGSDRILELRKNFLCILGNIGNMVTFHDQQIALAIIEGLMDFLNSDTELYEDMALEILAKIAVHFNNREQFLESQVSLIAARFQEFVTTKSVVSYLTEESKLAKYEYWCLLIYELIVVQSREFQKRLGESPGLLSSLIRALITFSNPEAINQEMMKPIIAMLFEIVKVFASSSRDNFSRILDQYLDHSLKKSLQHSIMNELLGLTVESQVSH
ncbi:hypothetical protein K7432_005219 [Basidiobolus ranarum]|uniref:ARID domain-containing protein n=1 Tax=Basidiobolus ranarum TaxID=34480 RepID=A0ABR2WX02_9FUNG